MRHIYGNMSGLHPTENNLVPEQRPDARDCSRMHCGFRREPSFVCWGKRKTASLMPGITTETFPPFLCHNGKQLHSTTVSRRSSAFCILLPKTDLLTNTEPLKRPSYYSKVSQHKPLNDNNIIRLLYIVTVFRKLFLFGTRGMFPCSNLLTIACR